jgi:hypothetical protein
VQVVCKLTNQSSSSEHPYGGLIEDAAKRWLPELYARWQRALECWEAAGRPDHDPGLVVLDGWGSRPAVRNQIKAAVEEAGQALREACRRKLTTREWSATAMKGSPASARERLDGDFFLEAWIAMDGSGRASAGSRRSKVKLYGLRIRLAGEPNEPPPETKTSPSHDAVVDKIAAGSSVPYQKREVIQAPEHVARIKYSPDEAPSQFLQWAKEQQAKGEIIIAKDALKAVEGMLLPTPSRRIVRGWLKLLPPAWRARRGTSPKKTNRGA